MLIESDAAGMAGVLAALFAALALDAWLGDPRGGPLARLPHPVRAIGWLIGRLDRALNQRSWPAVTRRRSGALAVAVVVASCAAVGAAIAALADALPFGWIVLAASAAPFVAQRSLHRHVADVADALETSGLLGGRAAVGHIVGRDVRVLDRHGVARAAIESCAENFSDGVVAPCLWFVALGPVGLLAYKAINTLDSMIGHRSPRYLAFGMVAARLDDVANWLPARLSAALIAAAALVDGGDARRALAVARRDAGKHRSPNAGWPEAAMAAALGLSLGGPRRYGKVTVEDSWIGDGGTEAEPSDIRHALSLLSIACVVNAGWIGAAAAIAWAAA